MCGAQKELAAMVAEDAGINSGNIELEKHTNMPRRKPNMFYICIWFISYDVTRKGALIGESQGEILSINKYARREREKYLSIYKPEQFERYYRILLTCVLHLLLLLMLVESD